MYESEQASQEMRDSLKAKEDTIQSLTRELEELKDKGATHHQPHPPTSSREKKEADLLRDDIQGKFLILSIAQILNSYILHSVSGAREMREIMDQIKEENDNLKHKLSNKSSVIKSLKEDQAENKKDLKEIERKYEHECRIVQSLKNELRALDAKCEAATAQLNHKEKRNEDRRSSSKDHRSRVTKVGEDGVSSSGVTSPRYDVGQEASLLQEVKSLKEQLDVLKAQNESLRLEIENLQLQNDNLKNIIEIGKSTVETAKKISQDLAEENKAYQDKEGKLKDDLKSAQGNLESAKVEVSSLLGRLEKSRQSSSEEVEHITGLLKSKEVEISKLAQELSGLKENLKQEENSKILTELKRDDIRSKLAKCRENCRTIEESKKSLENDYKALISENKNAAAEIKTLKSHLSSSRAIVVEKAVAKDEINKIKSELTSKTIEVEKSSMKLKKLGQQLSTSATEIKALTDLKTNHEAELRDLRDKVKSNRLSPHRSEAAKLKAKETELSDMVTKLTSCESAKNELQERLDFYIQQCSEFEKNDGRHQEEIIVLQNSIKSTTMEHSSLIDKYKESIQTLENAIVTYKGQVENLVEQNDNLKRDVQETRVGLNSSEDKELMLKYKVKCDAVEELQKKQEKVAAQLRRKDWEIANYQKKLDTAFEAGMTIGGTEDRGIAVYFVIFDFYLIVHAICRSPGQSGKCLKSNCRRFTRLGSVHPKEGRHQQQQAHQDGEDVVRLLYPQEQKIQ